MKALSEDKIGDLNHALALHLPQASAGQMRGSDARGLSSGYIRVIDEVRGQTRVTEAQGSGAARVSAVFQALIRNGGKQ
ncbi:hypothetical protein AAFF_G00412730 [Aldrovandia affinis]|uniref:Uncharacterized protein n=1 Tax=Aldrovandia affinis TaxID=143900 RepID=A0AAD7SB37_9TELE|nr:hypothetical protein AAFF_G00412730 [Aldrovandia affinis]